MEWRPFNISSCHVTCSFLFIDSVWIFQEEVLQEQERLKEEQCNIQKRSEQLLSIMQQFKGMWRHCLHGNRRGRRPSFVWETGDYWCHSLTVIFGFVCLPDVLVIPLCVCVCVLMDVTTHLTTSLPDIPDDLWCVWKDFSEAWWSKLRFTNKTYVIYLFHVSPQACVDRNWGPRVTKLTSGSDIGY